MLKSYCESGSARAPGREADMVVCGLGRVGDGVLLRSVQCKQLCSLCANKRAPGRVDGDDLGDNETNKIYDHKKEDG